MGLWFFCSHVVAANAGTAQRRYHQVFLIKGPATDEQKESDLIHMHQIWLIHMTKTTDDLRLWNIRVRHYNKWDVGSTR